MNKKMLLRQRLQFLRERINERMSMFSAHDSSLLINKRVDSVVVHTTKQQKYVALSTEREHFPDRIWRFIDFLLFVPGAFNVVTAQVVYAVYEQCSGMTTLVCSFQTFTLGRSYRVLFIHVYLREISKGFVLIFYKDQFHLRSIGLNMVMQ